MPKKITIPDIHGWNTKKEEFVDFKGVDLSLEHSLISLQKWEAKWHKPYLSDVEKTEEEIIDYIRCMTLTPNVDPDIYYYLPKNIIREIAEYINDPMTATTFTTHNPTNNRPTGKKEVVTSEIIYYWMIEFGIPMEYRKWHLNQLLTLIRVCELKNTPQKKMSRSEMLASNRALNAQRKAKMHTHG